MPNAACPNFREIKVRFIEIKKIILHYLDAGHDIMATEKEDWSFVGKTNKRDKRGNGGKCKHKTAAAGGSSASFSSSSSSSSSGKLNSHVAKARATYNTLNACTEEDTDEAAQILVQRVLAVANLLKNTAFWAGFCQVLQEKYGSNGNITPFSRPFEHLLVLGIGSFSTQHSSLLQMALACLLLQTLVEDEKEKEKETETEKEDEEREVGAVPASSAAMKEAPLQDKDSANDTSRYPYRGSTFDPVYSPLERRACIALGLMILPDLTGRYTLPIHTRAQQSVTIDSSKSSASAPASAAVSASSISVSISASTLPTLCFMPHCPYILYGNLLWSNWDAMREGNIVIIGNSFQTYALRAVTRIPVQVPVPVPVEPVKEGTEANIDTDKNMTMKSAPPVIPVDCLSLASFYTVEESLFKATYAKHSSSSLGVAHTDSSPAGQALAYMDSAFNDTCLLWFPAARGRLNKSATATATATASATASSVAVKVRESKSKSKEKNKNNHVNVTGAERGLELQLPVRPSEESVDMWNLLYGQY